MQPSSFAVWLVIMGCSIGNNGYAGENRVPAGPSAPPHPAAVQCDLTLPENLHVAVAAALGKENSAPFAQRAKLMPADGTMDDECGYAVALSSDGNTALIGAPYADLSGSSNQGAVYVFTRSGDNWSQQKKLIAGDGVTNDNFGVAVALSGDGNTALIGALNAEVNGNAFQGAAYVFLRGGATWSQPVKLTADDGAAGHLFGYAVALSTDGTTALIGATWSMITNYGAGGYVFTSSGANWTQRGKLMAADGAVNNGFAAAVALSGNGYTALIGAPNARSGVIPGVGAAYVFTRALTGWTQQKKLTASDGTQGAHFGWATALNGDGNTALIGAYNAIVGRDMQGAAYVFTRSSGSWSQQQILAAEDGAEWDTFGWATALSTDGNTVLIGALNANVGGITDAGAAYVFTRSGNSWSQQQKLAAADGAAYDYFGQMAALSGNGNTALVGAYYPHSLSWQQKKGAGYVFVATDLPPTGPTIKANNATGNVTIYYPDPLTITVEMNAGIYAGAEVDWWVVAFAHSGQWYYMNNSLRWTPFSGNLAECRPVNQGPLFNLPSTTVLDQLPLSRGTYDFWFAVDYPMDGILNPAGQLMSDNVTVAVQ